MLIHNLINEQENLSFLKLVRKIKLHYSSKAMNVHSKIHPFSPLRLFKLIDFK